MKIHQISKNFSFKRKWTTTSQVFNQTPDQIQPQNQPQHGPRRWTDLLRIFSPISQPEVDLEAQICRPQQNVAIPDFERRENGFGPSQTTVFVERTQLLLNGKDNQFYCILSKQIKFDTYL